jgi:hypothetical protein
LELGKQAVRFVSQKQKRSKTWKLNLLSNIDNCIWTPDTRPIL